jgi:hypothetical protein
VGEGASICASARGGGAFGASHAPITRPIIWTETHRWWYRRRHSGGNFMAVQNDPLKLVYNRWERFLNRVSGTLGKDRELDQLSEKMVDIKSKAFSDGILTQEEIGEIHHRLENVAQAYMVLLKKRGIDLDKTLPTTKEAFRAFGENQEIHFQYVAGKDLRSGVLGDLAKALKGGDGAAASSAAKKVAFDLLTSATSDIAADKVKLLRAALSVLPERSKQLEGIDLVREALTKELAGWKVTGGKAPPLGAADFERAVKFQSAVSVQKTELPEKSLKGTPIKGSNKLFPNEPIGPAWEKTTRDAVARGLDDLAKVDKLFLKDIPADGKVHEVAVKVDLNLGADGEPSVSGPATLHGSLLELLDRADKEGRKILLTVGDSSGGENIPLGRTTMDIMRDTGNYHMALKAGLTFAAKKGSLEAKEALGFIEDAEKRGVYFASAKDKETTQAQIEKAAQAAKAYVATVDYDAAGYVSVDPALGPIGLAAWGTREFQIAEPWVRAEKRVHVTRGVSNHFLAGWTGALKGLIGLHAFGLRPVDQGMNKRGDHPLDVFKLLSQASGFMAIFQKRTGVADVIAKIEASNDPVMKQELEKVQALWDNLRGNVKAWSIFHEGTQALANELDQDRKGGSSEVALMDKMRWQTRAILEKAEKEGEAPGFKQGLWDAMHAATRVAMVAGRHFRSFVPADTRDERAGSRIGLLTALPYQSDLVIQSQAKIGLGGGPDAYHEVKDVGVVSVGTDEASVDAMSWRAAGLEDHIFGSNWPVHFAQLYGRGPMHYDEVQRLDH